jgi:hypothetical protein
LKKRIFAKWRSSKQIKNISPQKQEETNPDEFNKASQIEVECGQPQEIFKRYQVA